LTAYPCGFALDDDEVTTECDRSACRQRALRDLLRQKDGGC
jgi:hypothetical protein